MGQVLTTSELVGVASGRAARNSSFVDSGSKLHESGPSAVEDPPHLVEAWPDAPTSLKTHGWADIAPKWVDLVQAEAASGRNRPTSGRSRPRLARVWRTWLVFVELSLALSTSFLVRLRTSLIRLRPTLKHLPQALATHPARFGRNVGLHPHGPRRLQGDVAPMGCGGD